MAWCSEECASLQTGSLSLPLPGDIRIPLVHRPESPDPSCHAAMQLIVSAMTSLRDILVAALKSFLRGKSILRALLAFWSTSPAPPVSKDVDQPISASAAADFLIESERLLLGYAGAGGLKEFSRQLKRQFRDGLRSNPACMLPSYNSQLPTGHELGQYLALDVGGSTLRVALVDLRGRGVSGCESGIVRMNTFKIDADVRNLEGLEFFDWMAERIRRTVAEGSENGHTPERPLLAGLSWSFPIEYGPYTPNPFTVL